MDLATRSRRVKIIRPALVAVVALVVGGMLALGMTAPAFATQTGTVTLKLTTKTGVLLSGYDVYPVDISDGAELPSDDPSAATLESAGVYQMSGLNSGDTYTLFLAPNGAAASSGTIQYLGGAATLAGATTFIPTFTPTSTNYFLAASIATGGTIVGKVTGPTGLPLKNAEVDAYQFDGTNWTTSDFTRTSSTGVFEFVNAVPGSYKFEFYAAGGVYPPIYSGGTLTLATAVTTFVSVGATASVNQRMVAGTGAISGSGIVNFDGFTYYDGDRVPVAFPVTAQSGPSPTAIDIDKSIAGAASNSKGAWIIKNLPAGPYVVELISELAGESANFLSPSGGDVPLSGATIYNVTAGHTIATGLTTFTGQDAGGSDFNLEADPQFTIHDSLAAPISGAVVEVAPITDPTDLTLGTSDENGVVTLFDPSGKQITGPDVSDNAIEPGYYTVTVIDPKGNHDPILPQVQFLGFGIVAQTLVMPDLSATPGFSVDPDIAQTATVVGTQYAVTATATRDDAVLTYQWLRQSGAELAPQPIYGATGATYTSTGADLGDQVSVRVTASSFGFNPVYAYASVGGDTPTVTTIGDAAINATLPSVTPATGIFVGSILQAHVGDWTIDGTDTTDLHYSYLWSVGGTAVTTATASTYVVQPGDVGSAITVAVTATKPGYTDSDAAVSTDVIVPGLHPAPILTKSFVVAVKTLHGVTTYSSTVGAWNTTGLTFHYVWSVGGTLVSSAASVNSTTIANLTMGTLPEADPLTVTVTTQRTGYAMGSATRVMVKGTAPFVQTADPTILDVTQATDVSGTDPVNYGDHLTVAAHGTWTPNNGISPSSYVYQWYRNDVAIKGATTASYVVTTADLSLTGTPQLSVVETAFSAYYPNTVGAPTLVGAGTYLTLAAPTATLVGPSEIGQPETVAVDPVAGVTNTFQWYGCLVATLAVTPCTDSTDVTTFTPISKATASTLVVSAAYSEIAVAVTSNKVGYTSSHLPVGPSPVVDATNVFNTAPPTIIGTASSAAHVGVKLTAGVGKWSVATPTYGYVWQTSTDGGTTWNPVGIASTYTPTPADYAGGVTTIELTVTATKGGNSLSETTTAYPIDPGTITLTTAPKLTVGTMTESVTPGVYVPAAITGGTVGYQWYVNGTADASTAIRDRVLTVGGDAGKAIYVVVTYSVPGYNLYTYPILVAQRGTTTALAETISGPVQYDGLARGLTVASPFADADAVPTVRTLTYQWYLDGVAIKRATHSTFTPSYADIGKHLTVRVTGSSALYLPLTVTSAILTLLRGQFAAAALPTLSYTGMLQPGTVATAVPDNLAGYGTTTGVVFAYQWQRSTNGGVSWVSISKASRSTYIPLATDATAELRVEVTAMRTGFFGVSLFSLGTTVAYSPDLATFTPPLLSGTGKVGGALVVSPGVWNTPTLTYGYAWYRNGILIAGVVGATWTPTADSVGDVITATVTATRIGWASVTVSSQSVLITPASAAVETVPSTISLASPGGAAFVVSTGTWSVDGLAYSYQWFVGGDPASGAGDTSATFTPDGSQTGQLSVVIAATRNGYADSTVTILGPTLPLP